MTTPGAADLGRLLRSLIADAGSTAARVGRAVGKSESMMSRYLKGAHPPKPDMVRQILATIGATGDDAEDAIRLAEDLDKPRIVILRHGSATSQARWNELQARTSMTRSFNGQFVPGSLQTERYARTLFEAAGQPPDLVDRNVAGRMERWAMMDDPRCTFVEITTEGALRHHIHSPDVMVEQCERIAERARRDDGGRVRIGMIPWTRPGAVFPLTTYTIYDDSTIVVGTKFGTAYGDRSADVAPFLVEFERLEAWAVFGEACAVEVERIADDYRALINENP